MDEAVKALRQATSADAGYAEAYYALSRIYRRQGRTAEADAAMTTSRSCTTPGGSRRGEHGRVWPR